MEKGLVIDWTDLSMDAKWYDFESEEVLGIEKPEPKEGKGFLQIRPYPNELMDVKMQEDGVILAGVKQKEIYDYCFLDMQGFPGADGKLIEFSEEVKKAIFDFQLLGIPRFVILKSREHSNKKDGTEKNL